MNIRNSVVYVSIVSLAVFGALGWSLAISRGHDAKAESNNAVDGETLDALYNTIFHRPADDTGRGFHLGRDLKAVLRDFMNSQEMRYYGALFKAVKSYEEAQRAPGTLTPAEKDSYLQLIDSALSNLLAWVDTLPQQDPCRATVRPEDAKEALEEAHDRLSDMGKSVSMHGIFDPEHDFNPHDIVLHPKCLRPSHSPTATPSPTPTPTASQI